MSNLQGKKILMISPYGPAMHYTQRIKEELEKRGAIIRLYDERPSQAALVKIYLYLFRKIAPQFFFHYVERIVQENEEWRPDVVFIVRGQAFDAKILSYMHEHFKESKFLFYEWDPLCGKKIPDVLEQYDYAYSFDSDDVKNNPEFKFRPSFFLREYLDNASCHDYKYDVSFVGTLYNNRWAIIKRFQEYFESHGLSSYFYLYMASWTLYLWDFIRRGTFVSPKKMQFKAMSYIDIIKVVRDSKSVLDIVYSQQSGLSMRAFESMAAHRKYITNNAEVMKYDFYNPNNILVVDINNIDIPTDFLETPFEEVDKKVMYKYSVEGLVDELFESF